MNVLADLKKIMLYIMSALYMLAGINHFLHPKTYERIMPSWIGWHRELVFLSGVSEMFFGLLLIPLVSRKIAAWGIILMLVAIFPANIQMMLNYLPLGGLKMWISIIRLPLQILLIWWAWQYTKDA
ncbi:MAG TPA: hypothetical protein VM101_12180 [Flavitalea sp.]|nr:hypothetical protein [Flavitalea sp.]